MASFVIRSLLSTGCRFVLTSGRNRSLHFHKRAFCYSRPLTALLFTEKHEWVSIKGKQGTVGISEYAQEQLGEIVYVELPEVGTTLQAENVAGCLESVKAASEIYSPVSGNVTEVNQTLESSPELVNSAPETDGWLYKMDIDDGTDTSKLMEKSAYKKYIETLAV